MLLLGRKTARRKVVPFIVSLSRRAEKRGYGPSPVSLLMNRTDIADYLGLTTETGSCTFTNLKGSVVLRLLIGNMVGLVEVEAFLDLAEGA